uniref:3-oxoacyl-[acyl-carrier-protein] reductase n=1 Tax=Chaetoceros debilis TaxID=122233 RepID=A0A7S3QGR3_9STRA|mmetsp:Transcript_8537/g.12778  ORF Transcript_8537/g.12778 Transcript_8537/m.12778 type:complete len:294 (-) Transcript_8537:346-1227(-)
MKLFTAFALAFLAGSASAFTPSSFTPASLSNGLRTTSTLNMVADDAKVILVTGASRGLGRAIACDLGAKGQKVVVNYAGSVDAANETVEMVKAAGGDAIAVQANVGSPDDIKEMFAVITANEDFGTVDVLINNAGITKDGLVMRMKPKQWQDVIDINLSGVFYTTQAFFKLAMKKRKGRIINISSVVGQIGNPGQANYAAAKGGVIGLTMSNAKEFSTRGITVNCICPGFIESDMTAELSDDYLAEVSKGIPLGRLGKPAEVAGMASFLALDDAADYITGHTFNVDGGIAIGA